MLNILLTVQPFGVCIPPAPLVLCAAAALVELALVLCAAAALVELAPTDDGEIIAAVAEWIDDEISDADDADLDEYACCIVVGSAV